jgi:cytochrome c biogenesis protein CcmG, thiol:disulfide interchange protein DsbE
MRIPSWLAIGAALVLAGCSWPGAGPAPTSDGSAAPGFTVKGLDGSAHSLADYRGKVVVLNFWATWCIPCRAEIPDLEHEARVHKTDPVVILGMDWKEPVTAVKDFTTELRTTYPMLLDSDGHVYDAYRVSALPTTFVLDRKGHIKKMRLGIASRDEIEAEIKDALKT